MPDVSPFASLARGTTVRRSTKRHLLALSRSIESRALAAEPAAHLWVCLQHVDFHSGRTLALHRELASHGVGVSVYGIDVRGGSATSTPFDLHDISPHGLLALEWNLLLVTQTYGLGLAARQVATGEDMRVSSETTFDWVVSEDRADVQYAAESLPTDAYVVGPASGLLLS